MDVREASLCGLDSILGEECIDNPYPPLILLSFRITISTMVACTVCGKDFLRKGWPTTKHLYCSSKCRRKAYYQRNKERILAETKRRNEGEKRGQRLNAQRNWNNPERGRERKRQWHEKNRSALSEESLRQYTSSPYIRAVYEARRKSRARLKRISIRQCVFCLARHREGQRIECHHIDRDPLSIEDSNLVWLCHRCHSLVHSEIPQDLHDRIEHSIQESLSQRQTVP